MATSDTNALTDSDLTLLAQHFNQEDFIKLGERLGCNQTVINQVTEEGDGAILRILTAWRNANSEPIDMHSTLAEKLREEFPEQAAFLVKQFMTPVVRETGVSDEFLSHLAEDIQTEEHAESLARNLGFKEPAIRRYMETNRLQGRVTCRGTRDMLYNWREKTISKDQNAVLKKALVNSGMARLAEDLPDITPMPEDIYSLSITDNLTVHGCRQKLINRYKKSTCKIQLRPWDKEHIKDIQSIYTVVTMVKRDREGNELKRVVLKGSVNEIFSTTIDDMQPERIILLAPAGKGKTTAVAKLAYDWLMSMKGSPLKDVPLLFVIKLRNVSQMMSLGEAIISQLLDDVEGLTPDSLERFIEKNQEICHIIMDGVDEYPGSIKERKGKSTNTLVKALKGRTLRKCRILATARPHLEQDFDQGDLPLVYTKMEIEGFTPESVTIYIDKFFSHDEDKSKSLKLYLEKNEVIKELTSVPFFTMMVCHLWSEKLLDGITTQTALFDNVNTFFRRHLEKKGRKITDESFNRAISGLGKVALTSLLADKNKLIFTEDDFKEVPEAYELGIALGIISSTTTTLKHVTAQGPTEVTTVEFYHKLAQEYAAGKYLATTYREWRDKFKYPVFDNSFKKIQKRLADYGNLLRFAAGAKDTVCVKVLKTVLGASTVSDEEKYRILLDCSSESTDLSGELLDLVRRCIGDGAMILQAPTVHTAVGLKKLPIASKQQISRLHISTQKLTIAVASKLALSIGDLPNLKELVVEENTSSMILRDGQLMMKSASKEVLCVFAGLHAAAFQKIWRLDISGIYSSSEGDTNFLLPVTMHCLNANVLNVSVNAGGSINTLREGLHPNLMEQLRSLQMSLPGLPEGTGKNTAAEIIGSCEGLDEFKISIAGGSDNEFLAKMAGDGTGQLVLTNPSSQFLDVLSGLHENILAGVSDIEISTPTLQLDLAAKISSFIGRCANMTDVAVHIDELTGYRSTLLSLHGGVLRINPLASLVEAFQSLVAGFHQWTLERVTELMIRVPRMTAPATQSLENSIGRCVNVTKLLVDADGDDVHAIMRKLHQETLLKVTRMKIILEQRSTAGIRSFASIIGRFPCIQELEICSLTYLGEEKLLTLKNGALMMHSPNMHPILSNLHIDILKTVVEMYVFVGSLSPAIIGNLSSAVGQCSSIMQLTVCGLNDDSTESTLLNVSDGSMSLNLVSKEVLPIIAELPPSLLAEVLHVEVTASDLPYNVALALTKSIGMLSRGTYLTVKVSNDTGNTEMLTMCGSNIKVTCAFGQLLPVLAGLAHTHGNITTEGDIYLSVPRLTDTIVDHIASVLEVLSSITTVLIIVAEGTADEVSLSLKSGKLAISPLSPTLMPLLKTLTDGILTKVNGISVWAPKMTKEVENMCISIFKKPSDLQTVSLHLCKISEVTLVLNALQDDIAGKIQKLWITLTDPLSLSDDKLGSGIGRFPALEELLLDSTGQSPQRSLEVRQDQLSVTGPSLLALLIAVSLHQRTLKKVTRVHISGYSPDESSVDYVKRCIGLCSNIKQLAFAVASSDDLSCFMESLDENSAEFEHLQVFSPELPTPLAVQLSSISRSCPSVCSILVGQKYRERRHHGPPADLPVISLQGNARLSIRLCSEDGEIVLVKTEPVDTTSLLERLHHYSPEKVQVITVSAPFMTMSATHKLASFIGNCSAFTSLSLSIDKGTKDEASMSLDRHHLRLKNMSEAMIAIVVCLHDSMKIEIHSLDIRESGFQPECSHRWSFIPFLVNLSRVGIENSLLNLHGSSPSLFFLLEQCRRLSSMTEISIWQCGTDGLGRLESYVESCGQARTGITVHVQNASPHYTYQRRLPYA